MVPDWMLLSNLAKFAILEGSFIHIAPYPTGRRKCLREALKAPWTLSPPCLAADHRTALLCNNRLPSLVDGTHTNTHTKPLRHTGGPPGSREIQHQHTSREVRPYNASPW